MTWSIRVSTGGSARLQEARHDLLAQDAQVVALAVEITAADAYPQLGRAGLGQLLDARDPVAQRAGEGEAPSA